MAPATQLSTPGSRQRHSWPWLLAVLLATAVVYWPSLLSGFVVDDVPVVRENPYIRDWSQVGRFFTHGTWANTSLQTEGAPIYRPLLLVSFTAQYSLWNGSALGYHLVALLLHLAAAALVFVTARQLFGVGALAAVLGAALFAWHPARVESVAWISAQNDAMAAACLLSALLAHHRRSQGAAWGWTAVSLGCFALALGSKEASIAFPLVLAAHDRWIARRAQWPALAAHAALATGYLALRAAVLARADSTLGWSSGAAARIGDFLLGYAEMLGLPLAVPFHLVPPAASVGGWPGWISAAVLAAAAAWLLRDDDQARRGQAAFALSWVVLFLWPVVALALYKQGHYSARHLYLAAIGIAWCGALIARRSIPSAMPVRAGAAVAALLLLAAQLALTRTELPKWRDDGAVYGEVARLAPASPVGPLGIARFHFDREDYRAARPQFEAALRLARTAAERVYPLEALGTIAGLSQDWPAAEAYFNEAVQIDPDAVDAWAGLGNLAWIGGRLDDALFYYEKAYRLKPGHPEVVANLIAVYDKLGRSDRARQLRLQQAQSTRSGIVTGPSLTR